MSPQNNFIATVESGAKGQFFFNIAQITGLLGQQQVLGGRIPYTLTNHRRSLPTTRFPNKIIQMIRFTNPKDSFVRVFPLD